MPEPRPAQIPISERIMAAAVALCLLAVLVTGACLTPEAQGHSTHEQLGLPACGFLASTGRPCPTCGMTTAVSRMAHRDIVGSFAAQPGGALFAMAAAVGFWGAAHVAVFGSRIGRVASRMLQPRVIWSAVFVWVLTWGYKILTWT